MFEIAYCSENVKEDELIREECVREMIDFAQGIKKMDKPIKEDERACVKFIELADCFKILK